MRPTEAIVDLAAISANVVELIRIADGAQVCVVVKADAYGHGAVAVARAAIEAGASWLAVALVEEGIELRDAGVVAPILVLSEPRPREMLQVVEFGLTATIYTPEGVAALVAAAGSSSHDGPVPAHLKLDTGMNRVGLTAGDADGGDALAEVRAAVEAIVAKPEIRLAGVWTHLAVADEPDHPETPLQLQRFNAAIDAIRDLLDDDVNLHASNSAGLLGWPTARFSMVRTGIAAYGIAPSAALSDVCELRPAMALRTEIGLVKTVQAGQRLSYGLRHEVAETTRIATIPIGYADGLRRSSYAHGATVLVGGLPCPIVGVVTMDQALVELGPDSTAAAGDEVVLIGHQSGTTITATDVADRLDTIPYEIVCDIGRRVRRRYV